VRRAVGLLERISAARSGGGETRSSIDQWISEYLLPSGMVNQFTFGGHVYGMGQPNLTYGANKAREFSNDLPGHTAAVKACPPAFAAEMVRALVLSQARFTYRNRPWTKTPRRTFGTSALALLERPWPNGTTGDLIRKMEWHAGLAGNSFVTNWQQNGRLRVLRPDWCAVVYGSQQEPDDPTGALDGEILGYVYQNGGIGPFNQNELRTLPVSSVAHWYPLPDPENAGLGMSWITPAIRDIQGDMLAAQHKVTYFSNGAAQPYNAGVLTPTGWARMEDISAGDFVTGPDGKPRRVLGVYPQGEKNIYRVTFSGGATAECCEDHLWRIATIADRKAGTYRVVTLREIIDAGIKYASGPPKWSVPLTDPVEYSDPGPLPVHPYLLGALLGDGSFRSNGKGSGGVALAANASDADEQLSIVSPLLPEGVTISRRDRGGWSEFYFKGPGGPLPNPLTRMVRDLGLFDVIGHHKSVPGQYMRGSVTDRIALLQGLIDTDGHVNRAPYAGVTFSSTSETLARQVQELARSLGGRAGCKQAGERRGEPGRRPQWRVYISRLPEWIIPVRLSRKRASYHPAIRGGAHRHQYIQSIEFVRRAPAQCIKVDADDGLYVTDDFIVTHNTPNLVVKGIPAVTKEQFDGIVDMIDDRHTGIANAYRTLYLTAGADASVVGANLAEIDFRAVQAGGETRVSFLSRVPAPLLGIGEGLQGSSLNSGNFAASRRMFADSWIFPVLQDLAATLAPLVSVPADAELWTDTADMPILREDAKDAADIEAVKASTITALVKDGFSPESAIIAVTSQDMTQLVHTGLVSVQLQPPRTELQKAQTIQLESLAAELLVRAGYTTDSARDAVHLQDMSLLKVGPLTSRYLVVNPLEAGAEPGVPLGFPNAQALGLPAPPGYPGGAPAAVPGVPPPDGPEAELPDPGSIPGFSPDAQAGNEPAGGM
jgi:hypothetical protein